jgi:SAM-dependent methyltransferase
MKANQDAYGHQLLAQLENRAATYEIIERDDDFIAAGSDAGYYFSEYEDWAPFEQEAIARAKGRTLDVGCGAGRHSLYLQEKGFDATGIDNSPGAIKVCKQRGLKEAIVRSIVDIDKFKANSFDAILMMGNNFGLFGSAENAKLTLEKMFQITSPEALIIAGSLNPYKTDDPDHLSYHRLNKRRGRMPGQIKMRVRFRKAIGEWFDYLFVSPEEMMKIIGETNWQIEKFIAPDEANYVAIIEKKSARD